MQYIVNFLDTIFISLTAILNGIILHFLHLLKNRECVPLAFPLKRLPIHRKANIKRVHVRHDDVMKRDDIQKPVIVFHRCLGRI